jgi:hypothetical protein
VGLVLWLALLVALAASAGRGLQIWRRKRGATRQPGATYRNPIVVSSFAAIDEEVGGRACPCGGHFKVLGEGSVAEGDQRLRVVRLECADCEALGWIHFDVTQVYQ